jgi:type II secretory pathway pseudopilin PulG
MRRVALVLVILLIGIALLVGLHPISPARTADAYSHKAKDTAESVLSSVENARLAARAGTRGDAFGPYVSVLLSESETGVAKAQGVFESIQPPDRHADAVRRRLGTLTSRANDAVARLRITARRGDLGRLEDLARPLRPLAAELQHFIDEQDAS